MQFEVLCDTETMMVNGGFDFGYAIGAAACMCVFCAACAAAPVTMGASVAVAGAALFSLTGVGVCTTFAIAF